MDDLTQLYQDLILDHSRNPRHFGSLVGATTHARGHNPLCGDDVTVHLQLDHGIVQAIQFEGVGCAISIASASLMAESVQGKTVEEVFAILDDFQALLTQDDQEVMHLKRPGLEKLEVFVGVRSFPMRVKCATLAWHTLKAALSGDADSDISTE